MELNGLAVRLQSECKPETCTQMTATEQWIFLCAAHKTPKECPAIDYTRHTLDGAACLLNSNKYFPSRYVAVNMSANLYRVVILALPQYSPLVICAHIMKVLSSSSIQSPTHWPSADWQTSNTFENIIENSQASMFPCNVFLHSESM